jgi:hypothetical protein
VHLVGFIVRNMAEYLTKCGSSVYSTVLIAEHFRELSVRQHQKFPKTNHYLHKIRHVHCKLFTVFTEPTEVLCMSLHLLLYNLIKMQQNACTCFAQNEIHVVLPLSFV